MELERELAPGLVGLGRYLGLGARRSVELARALDVSTPDEFREAAAAGRLRSVPGVGPKIEAQILDALAREGEPRPQRGLLLPHARELVGAIAGARWTASRPATRAAGATAASGSRSSAPPPSRPPCSRGSPSCRRSSPSSSGRSGARSA